jgi:hypothetical protein
MRQRFENQKGTPSGDSRHRAAHTGRPASATGVGSPLASILILLVVSLLAPPTVSAQDRSQVRATAAVLPAGPSQAALRSALRQAQGRVPGDTAEAAHSRLARLRVRRPGPRDEATLVVSIEFLRN